MTALEPLDEDAVSPAPSWRSHRLVVGGFGVALAVAVAVLLPASADRPLAGAMAGVAALMAVWWVFEVVPIAVTALLPIALLPALGIQPLAEVTAAYGKPAIFLFLGGFLLALGLQRSGLHRRIALHIVSRIGSRPTQLVLGFMLASAALSMWLSNTASVMVMMPIALSILDEALDRGADRDLVAIAGTAVMLGIAYAADIGGMATPVGTPPNLALIELQQDLFPDAPPIAFLAAGWVVLTRYVFVLPRTRVFGESHAIRAALAELGPMRRDEWLSGGVFAAIAALWITGSGFDLGESLRVPGWRDIDALAQLGDGAVAIAGAIALFLIPSADRPGEALMDWDTARRVPWGILLLFGGGFALAGGFVSSGLSATIGEAIAGLRGVPTILVIVIVATVLTFLTELTSNTATTNLVLPILAQAAVALALDPRLLMIPATLSASCAFMMPVASPTQAIVFGSGYITIRQMVRAGIWFNLLGIALVTLVFVLLGAPLLGVDMNAVPAWAAEVGAQPLPGAP
jgi:sodium-dependent dicarboxylate transporter 2/3/5